MTIINSFADVERWIRDHPEHRDALYRYFVYGEVPPRTEENVPAAPEGEMPERPQEHDEESPQ